MEPTNKNKKIKHIEEISANRTKKKRKKKKPFFINLKIKFIQLNKNNWDPKQNIYNITLDSRKIDNNIDKNITS